MQEKTSTVANNSARFGQFGLNIRKGKSKVLRTNATANTTPITLDGEALQEVDNFTYLGSIVDKLMLESGLAKQEQLSFN
ncbi:hypothetical protein V1264_018408 [Littorina saxatilis]|uniref:Uncharacterized protein n=1 Tax=Littorina saxatilis TaxID=31220 RepID=A0AAN9BCQ5_9CAEN